MPKVILNNSAILTKKDKVFNKFLAKRIQSDNSNAIFQIDRNITEK